MSLRKRYRRYRAQQREWQGLIQRHLDFVRKIKGGKNG